MSTEAVHPEKEIQPRRRSLLVPAGLFIVLILGTGVRILGLDFGLPLQLAKPDEEKIASIANRMLGGNFRPSNFNYPPLVGNINFLVRWAALHTTHRGEGDREKPLQHTFAFMASRIFSASAGVLTVLLVFLLGRAAFSTQVGLSAAFLLALTHLHARDSHFGLTDTPLTFFVTLGMFPILALVRTGSWRSTLLSGFLAGLAFSAKYPGLVLWAPLGLAHLIVFPPNKAPRSLVLRLAGAAAFFLLAFALTCPQVLLEPARFFKDFFFEIGHKTASDGASILDRGWVQHATHSLRYGLGLPYLIAAGAGLIAAVSRRSRPGWLIVTFILAYYICMGSGTLIYVRYMLPLTPFLAIAAAVAMDRLAGILWPSRRILLGAVLSLVVVSVSAVRVFHTDRLMATEDTRIRAARYLNDLMGEEGRVLFVGGTTLPALSMIRATMLQVFTAKQLDSLIAECKNPARVWEGRIFLNLRGEHLDRLIAECGDPASAFRGKVDYIAWGDYFFDITKNPSPEAVSLLRKTFSHVKTFSPLEEGAVRSDLHPVFNMREWIYIPYAGFEGLDRMGPFIHVYRVDS